MNEKNGAIDRRQVLIIGSALALLPAMASVPKTAALRGTVFYRERMALPPDAVVEVKLVDVSRADAPSTTIGQTNVAAGSGTATPFEIEYDPSRIKAGNRYALQARIAASGTLLFINDTAYPVFTGQADKTDILVTRVSSEPDSTQSPIGRWVVETIGGIAVIDGIQSTLDIRDNGTAGGKGGCNSFRGSVTIDGSAISFSGIAATMMACARPAMDQERRFFAALRDARSFRLEGEPAKLLLLDDAGAAVAALRPA